MGGSSKKVTVGYRYHLGLHFVLCHGTADNISRITVDKRPAWAGNNTGGRININAPDLFGGESREGGVAGALDFLPGSATQAPNDYLQARLGADIPAFRGVVSAVLRQMYVGLNPYVKSWAFRVQRIFKRGDGSAQWYDSKAGISVTNVPDTMSFSPGPQVTKNMERSWFGAYFLDPHSGSYWFGGRSYDSPSSVIRMNVDGALHLVEISPSMNFNLEAGRYAPAWSRLFFFGKDGGASFRIAESSDHGNTWKVYSTASTNSGPWQNTTGAYWDAPRARLIVVGGAQTQSFIATGEFIPVSIGGGVFEERLVFTHRAITGDLTNYRAIGITSNPSGSVLITQSFTSNSQKYCRSVDGGETWAVHDNPGGAWRGAFGRVEWIPAIGAFGAYGVDTVDSIKAVFYTSSDGIAWSIRSVIPHSPIDHDALMNIVVDTVAGTILLGGGDYFAYSKDDGLNWQIGSVPTNIASSPKYIGQDFAWLPSLSKLFVMNRGWDNELEVCFGLPISGTATGDMNPAHIIRECLTDRDWGMGYADSDIDDAAFAAAADALHAETFGISIVWDRQSTIEAFIEQILRHIDAALYVDRRTGKFVLKLIRNDYTVGTLLTLDESNIERVEGLGRPAFGELINSISVAYWDAETGNDAAITLDDTALVQMQGGVINTTAQYPGITSRSLAARVAQRDLRTLSQPLLSCTIYATRAASALDIGDAFVLTWPAAGISGVVMRVTGLALGDGRNNRVRITCTQDAFALPAQAVIAPPADEWVSPIETPLPAIHRAAQEAPYYELVQLIGQLNADARLAANPDAGWLMVSAARPQDSAINAVISVDAGAGFEQSAPLDFAPWAQLAAGIGRADTSITVESGIDLAAVTLGTHAQIGAELVRIDAIDLEAGVVTIGRGVLDTVPHPHDAGAGVLFWDAYAVSDEVEYVAAESVSVKVLPATSAGLLSIDAAPTDVATMDRRARRPYPPGNLRIEGVLMPTTIGAADELGLIEWAHRDRTQQTSGTLADTTAGNIGPEAGTTYTLRIYDESDALGFELTGIAGTSHTYTEADELADMPQDDGMGGDRLNTQLRIELFAVRDGLESWQMHNLTITRA